MSVTTNMSDSAVSSSTSRHSVGTQSSQGAFEISHWVVFLLLRKGFKFCLNGQFCNFCREGSLSHNSKNRNPVVLRGIVVCIVDESWHGQKYLQTRGYFKKKFHSSYVTFRLRSSRSGFSSGSSSDRWPNETVTINLNSNYPLGLNTVGNFWESSSTVMQLYQK